MGIIPFIHVTNPHHTGPSSLNSKFNTNKFTLIQVLVIIIMVAPINKMTIRTILCGLLVAAALSARIQPSGAQDTKRLLDAETATKSRRKLCVGYTNGGRCPHGVDPSSPNMCGKCYAAYRNKVGSKNQSSRRKLCVGYTNGGRCPHGVDPSSPNMCGKCYAAYRNKV